MEERDYQESDTLHKRLEDPLPIFHQVEESSTQEVGFNELFE